MLSLSSDFGQVLVTVSVRFIMSGTLSYSVLPCIGVEVTAFRSGHRWLIVNSLQVSILKFYLSSLLLTL